MTTTKNESVGTVGSTSGGRRGDCRVLFLSLEVSLRLVREESAPLATAKDEYKMQVRNSMKRIEK